MKTAGGLTTTDVKKMNKKRLFRLIHLQDGVSRQEAAEILNLSLPTVNQNLKILEEQGLIEYNGNYASTGGRKAQVIQVNADAKYAVNVTIRPNKFKVMLIDLSGKIIEYEVFREKFKSDDDYGQFIADSIDIVIKKNKIEKGKILGVGITMSGVFDEAGEVLVYSPPLGVRNFKIETITDKIGYRTLVMNDVRANAYAEFWFGQKSNRQNSKGGKFYLMVNEGVGGAEVNLSEKIETGSHNRFGEFGHVVIHPGGRLCSCGKKGCLEAYISIDRLSTDFNITLDEFFDQMKSGNKLYKKTFNQYINDLTLGVNNLYTIADTDIILGGTIKDYLSEYKSEIDRELSEKYSFETDGSYFSFAECSAKQLEVGAALVFLWEFVRNI